MKLYEIKEVAKYLKRFNFLKYARRVANNTIELNFNTEFSIYFDLTRGNSTIYKALAHKRVTQFNAPFDTLLFQFSAHSKIEDVDIVNNDKIIVFKIKPKSVYKQNNIFLRFELTGKYTNCIILNEQNIVLEALRHIDSSKSYRVIQPGVVLKEPPKFNSIFSGTLENVEEFLEQNYKKIYQKTLKQVKNQKLKIIDKKLNKLTNILNSLPKESELLEESHKYSNYANIILANLHKIKPYEQIFVTKDFEGDEISINLPQNIPKNRISEYFFNKAKRAKSKAKNIKLERLNLEEKIKFFSNIKEAILNSSDIYQINLLVPKQQKAKKSAKKEAGEVFWVEGYKIIVGKNSKENIEVLKEARANDIWMHVRQIPGSHVIIRTNKQNLPKSVLESAAKLCVDFSTKNPGNYEVDYTKRKFVKITDGSNVTYDKYKTIPVLKEGIEIRV
jgi:predicted ribosome quality control (RQC) complex YloA/Tae2 family protein